jgi:putative transposase
MRYTFIQQHATTFEVTIQCRVLGVSASGYYAWRKRPATQQQADAVGVAHIRSVHQQSRQTYGYRRITAALRQQGKVYNHKRVARLMRLADLRGCDRRTRRRPRTTQADPSASVSANVVARQFSAHAPNQLWVTDITYIDTHQGWLYLAALQDVFSRKIVGWAMHDQLDTRLVEAAWRMALLHRQPPAGLIHHSDRGCQYTSARYRVLLSQQPIVMSMSRTGDCYDNAMQESFWATLKAECAAQPFATHQQARSALFDYIEVFYNRQRLHSALGYRSPEQFERQFYTFP